MEGPKRYKTRTRVTLSGYSYTYPEKCGYLCICVYTLYICIYNKYTRAHNAFGCFWWTFFGFLCNACPIFFLYLQSMSMGHCAGPNANSCHFQLKCITGLGFVWGPWKFTMGVRLTQIMACTKITYHCLEMKAMFRSLGILTQWAYTVRNLSFHWIMG